MDLSGIKKTKNVEKKINFSPRVSPDILLKDLRSEIEKQCSVEEIPKDYVFLKSVGRALTRVKPYQEQEIKVKHFMPPQVNLKLK